MKTTRPYKKLFIILGVAVCLGMGALVVSRIFSADPIPVESSSDKKQAIDHLLEITTNRQVLGAADYEGMRYTADTLEGLMRKNDPDVTAQDVKRMRRAAEAAAKRIIDARYQQYADYFNQTMTLEDLRAVIAFLESPAGRKYLDTNQNAQRLAGRKGEDAIVLKEIDILYKNHLITKP